MATSERIIPTAVFIMTFIGIAALLINSLAGLYTRGQQNVPSALPPSPVDVLAINMTLTLYEPHLEQVNGTILAENTYYSYYQEITFTSVGLTQVGCAIFRNQSANFFSDIAKFSWNFAIPDDRILYRVLHNAHHDNPDLKLSDFIVFWQSWFAGNLNLDRRVRFDIISFPELVNNRLAQTNFSIVSSHLRYWCTEFIGWERDSFLGASEQDHMLWSNHFTVSVATGYNASFASIDPMTIIGQLLTFSLPNVPPLVQAMIAIPCYLGIVLVAVIIVAYFIP